MKMQIQSRVYFKYVAVLMISLFICNCTGDDEDGGPPTPPVVDRANEFSIGDQVYPMEEGFKSITLDWAPGVWSTFFVCTGDGLTVEFGDFSGRGNFFSVDFYTDNGTIDPGTYPLDNLELPGTAEVTYTINFDATNPFFPPDNVFNGTVVLERIDAQNYTITVNGEVNSTGEVFKAYYSGRVITII
jgi:hypothetical protein